MALRPPKRDLFSSGSFDLEAAVPLRQTISRQSPPGLLDGDFGAALSGVGQVLDATIDNGANTLQKLDPGIAEVLPHLRRHVEGFPDLVYNFAAQAALLTNRLRRTLLSCFLFAHCASFISTVRIRFSRRARAGTNVAIERGSPIWRLSVPTSTTSSSPFLNSPISPLVANGRRSRTAY